MCISGGTNQPSLSSSFAAYPLQTIMSSLQAAIFDEKEEEVEKKLLGGQPQQQQQPHEPQQQHDLGDVSWSPQTRDSPPPSSSASPPPCSPSRSFDAGFMGDGGGVGGGDGIHEEVHNSLIER